MMKDRTFWIARAVIIIAAIVIGSVVVASLVDAAPATKRPGCRAADHRTNAGPSHADENTIEGQRWDASRNIISEIDLAAIRNGTVAYHYKTWDQGSNGTGLPSETDISYVRNLVTKPRGQQVPFASEMLRSIKRTHGQAILELHYFPYWTEAHVERLLTQIRHYKLQRSVWLTGTKDALTMVKKHSGPLIQVMFRVKPGKPANDALLTKYGADVVQVRGSETIQRVRYYRAHGYPVWGSGPRTSFPALLALGIRNTQSDTPIAWLRLCRAA